MFTILHTKPEELPRLARLETENFGSDAWRREDFALTLNSPIDTVWTYRDAELAGRLGCEDDIIGYGVLRIVADEAELLKICIAPECRRQGAADLLLDLMMQKCMERRVARIWLECRRKNTAARGLYEKHGFQIEASRAGYYAEPEDDALLMLKSDYDYELGARSCGKDGCTDSCARKD